MEGEKRTEAEAGSSAGNDEKQRKSEVDDVEEDYDEKEECEALNFVPGPLLSLKDQIEKDKEDESLRRWKQKLLGCVEGDLNGKLEPEVKFHSIGILSDDLGEINTPLPVDNEDRSDCVLFCLKEGSRYQLKLTFTVLHNIVSGLTYSNTVWRGGIQVDQSNGMLGTFAPKRGPYIHALDEETTPSGVLARGIYTAMLKFQDDDKRCHMDLKYSFEIKKQNSS